jgi:flagellum-specific ATP synthase
MRDPFEQYAQIIESAQCYHVTGRVSEVVGLTVVAEGFLQPVGSMASVVRSCGSPIAAQVVGLRGDRSVLMPLHDPQGVAAGDVVTSALGLQHVPVGRQMLGTVLDGTGRAIEGNKGFTVENYYPVYRSAPPALSRRPIDKLVATGIRAIDAMNTVGCGQRVGVFAGTGVGKSVLMGMISRFTSAGVTVVALVGERGREVGDFLRKDLGEEGMKRTVLVVSTSDESPVLRVRAGFVATAVAEYFRDLGRDVLLMMDSTTRMAMAQRQIGLAAGEPPTTKGYPPSVFSLLPHLLERCGRTASGSITGLYTVLVEGDDITEPVADAMRGVLDGHLWLARDLANRAHYPAVSVLESISRVMPDVVDEEHLAAARTVRRVLAVWADIEDLVNIGAYTAGANVDFDVAVQCKPAIDQFLVQGINEPADFHATKERLLKLAGEIGGRRGQLMGQSGRAEVAAPAT